MGSNGGRRLRFGDFELDVDAEKLFRNGEAVKIQPQPLRVLATLAGRPGEIVSRDELRTQIWGDSTFVEFDQGLNYCIRQIRRTLGDTPAHPAFVETLPRQGYRFVAAAIAQRNGHVFPPDPPSSQRRRRWPYLALLCALIVLVVGAIHQSGKAQRSTSLNTRPTTVAYTQLTDFTDSAVAPALSPDGRMLAFIRGCCGFLTADPIYIKMLPDGEATRLTDDNRAKCCLAFSRDGSMIAYTVLELPNLSTYTVPVLGGEPRLFVSNAAGLTWLDDRQLLFSQIRSGLHLGVVTGTANRENLRELYFPPHEREMAHYSFASPDRKSALVVQMDEQGWWSRCQIISLTGNSPARPIGPNGLCTSAGWSPDGAWMYFTAYVESHSHLWRQRFPDGQPEQITSGPAEEDGVVVERDGHSVITSLGVHESALWIHDANGERALSSEGEIVSFLSPPVYSADGKSIYYLLSRNSARSGPELRRMEVSSGRSEQLFSAESMLSFDISPDQKQVVYTTGEVHESCLWIAPLDGRSPPRQIGHSSESSPHFGARGQILFRVAEGNRNYLEQMNPDGTGRSKVVPYPIVEIRGVSPGRRWIVVFAPTLGGTGPASMAIPADGGPPQIICIQCDPVWSPNGRYLYVPVEDGTHNSPGRSLAIKLGPNETLPTFPPGGILMHAEASIMPRTQSVNRANLIPGNEPSQFAFVNTTVHSNLYRVSIP